VNWLAFGFALAFFGGIAITWMAADWLAKRGGIPAGLIAWAVFAALIVGIFTEQVKL
jgi:fucose permease